METDRNIVRWSKNNLDGAIRCMKDGVKVVNLLHNNRAKSAAVLPAVRSSACTICSRFHCYTIVVRSPSDCNADARPRHFH
jgi:hypothetical protein